MNEDKCSRGELIGVIYQVVENLTRSIAGDSDLRPERLKKTIVESVFACVKCTRWRREAALWHAEEAIRGELGLGRGVVVIEAKLESEGLVGTSSGLLHAALEVGISWDYVIDVPLVPGPTVKGAVRSTFLAECANIHGRDSRLECLRRVATLFGWTQEPPKADVESTSALLGIDEVAVRNIASETAGSGLLYFHDVRLVCDDSMEGEPMLEPWVITPHYRDAESEYDVQPRPVVHLIVRPGLRGLFVVGVEPGALEHLKAIASITGWGPCSGRACVGLLADAMEAALVSGVGARTSRGYSRFRPVRVKAAWPR